MRFFKQGNGFRYKILEKNMNPSDDFHGATENDSYSECVKAKAGHKFLGYFKTIEEANAAVQKYEHDLFSDLESFAIEYFINVQDRENIIEELLRLKSRISELRLRLRGVDKLVAKPQSFYQARLIEAYENFPHHSGKIEDIKETARTFARSKRAKQ